MSARKTSRIRPPLNRSLNVISATPMSLFVSGYCCVSRAAMPVISVCAVARVAPGERRPKTPSERLSRFVSRSFFGTSGRHMSALVGKRMPSGMTPTIVLATSLTLIVRPSTAGSLPYRFFHTE